MCAVLPVKKAAMRESPALIWSEYGASKYSVLALDLFGIQSVEHSAGFLLDGPLMRPEMGIPQTLSRIRMSKLGIRLG